MEGSNHTLTCIDSTFVGVDRIRQHRRDDQMHRISSLFKCLDPHMCMEMNICTYSTGVKGPFQLTPDPFHNAGSDISTIDTFSGVINLILA